MLVSNSYIRNFDQQRHIYITLYVNSFLIALKYAFPSSVLDIAS